VQEEVPATAGDHLEFGDAITIGHYAALGSDLDWFGGWLQLNNNDYH
jgi:hypothetical protein